MKFIKTDKLEAGMVTARAIYHGRDLMLNANRSITSDMISSLSRINISGIYVYDEYSDLEELGELLDEGLRRSCLEAMEKFETDKVTFFANDIVDSLSSMDGQVAIDMNQLCVYDQSTYEHSLNVAITSTACGIGMGLSNDRLVRLACGALLHDCGKQAIPHSILNKPGKLTEEEWKKMQRHAQYGYDMLYNREEIHPESRAIALCHHENWDGSGYPKGLQGEQIPLLARIVHVADVYDALLRRRAYKDKFSQFESLEYLMGSSGTMFDYNVVTTFLEYIVAYPVGCDVVLSDGRTARVIANTPGYLERPKLAIGKEILNLAEDPKLRSVVIVGEVGDDEEEESPESELESEA